MTNDQLEQALNTLTKRVTNLETIIDGFENGLVSNLQYKQTILMINTTLQEIQTDITDLKNRVTLLEND